MRTARCRRSSAVLEVFQSEFDVAYQESGLYLLTMHPHMTGHRSRVAMLEKLVGYMKGKPGVSGSPRTSRLRGT